MICKECGNEIEFFVEEEGINKELLQESLCFGDWFWAGNYQEMDHRSVIVDGEHFVIRPDMKEKLLCGFGGQRFEIEWFEEGRPNTVTHNLWHQGIIPDHWRDRLPDNARFVKQG